MKINLFKWGLVLLLASQATNAPAIVFTSDTVIGPLNTSYDGLEIVVSNCTLTVDGPHSFAGIRVAAGGTLTHSGAPSGFIPVLQSAVDEPQILSGTNAATLANSNIVTASVVVKDIGGLVIYTNLLDYLLSTTPDALTALQRTGGSAIPDGGLVLVTYDYPAGTTNSGLDLAVAGDVEVESGGIISGDSKGFGNGLGTGGGGQAGSPLSGGGGGHGGYGGNSSGNGLGGTAHDVVTQPVTKGGGGGNGVGGAGGLGGGTIKLTASGSLQINGVISANGANGINSRSGGGAGGSIWLSAQTISGTGSISADGGAGEPIHGGGGGGGRIAIYFDTNSYSGSIVARGGIGFVNGGAGTIYTKTNSQTAGQILVDNGGRSGTNTLLQGTSGDNLMITGSAVAVPSGSLTFGNLLIASTGRMSPVNPTPMTVTVTGNATVQSGGSIMADGLGSVPRTGSGAGGTFQAGLTTIGGGGGHGGYGAAGLTNNATGGNSYGSFFAPNTLGSGGGGIISSTNVGGAGGGAVRLIVNGMLTLDGKLSANGNSAIASSGGGGAGGSIWLTAGTISGSGSISASGGNAALPGGGGGGGGRTAIEYGTNLFSGISTAYGGNGTNSGGAGTIYTKQTVLNGQLLLDNGGRSGTNTSLLSSPVADLTIRNGAVGIIPSAGPLTFINLVLGSNGWLTASGQNGTISVNVTGNATIDAQGGIRADGVSANSTGRGFSALLGNIIYGGGGGHGGYGGSSQAPNSPGGNSYGSVTSPSTMGSVGGGSGTTITVPPIGGLGGGAIRLIVSGTLTVNGSISSDGRIGIGNYAGGGSGGSVWLTVVTLSGSGKISAIGGSGVTGGGGGGGGGRVAVYYATNLFSGTISANGGGGSSSGGAGTIYTRSNSQPSGLVLIDNKGTLASTNTPLSTSSPDDFTVRGGAIAVAASPLTMRNLLIVSNGWLTFAPIGAAAPNLTVTGDAMVQAGGGIIADGKGSSGGQGTGNGSSSTKGGGGHGGYGGRNPSGTSSSGNVYGSIQSPILSGSGGGNGSGTTVAPFGGSGGGAIRFNVTRTLTLSGRISADGLPGDVNSGGGSGGSVWLTAGTLTGTGSISANGGAGNGSGGGGGGGRIALNYFTNLFAGAVSAYAGSGSLRGGAGTIYTKANNAPVGALLVDNGGLSGTNTPLSSAFQLPTAPFNLAVQGGAIVYFPTPPIPLLSNLVVSSSGLITTLSGQTNLELSVLRNVLLTSGGAIAVDGRGFNISNGQGAGTTLATKGGGGGYGGIGGAASSGAAGGTNYGSATQPVDRGSGGGLGLGGIVGGSDGGGAIHLTIGGTLTVDGRLGANGNAGLQDDSGGGSGGSIWVTAHTLAGGGFINADGGNGELFGGGGGGGGRIALYALSNLFNGSITAAGGNGASLGQSGTIFKSNTPPLLAIVSQTPVGVVSNAVSSVDLSFNMAFNPYTADISDVVVQTPEGFLSNNVTVSALNVSTLRLSFQSQTASGDYSIRVGPQIEDLFGRSMSQVYTGAFTILLPVIQGTVADTNGQPAAGVLLQPNNGFASATTDAGGNYTLGFVPGSTFTVTPSLSGFMFVPGTRSYTNVSNSVSNENYLLVTTIAPPITAGLSDTNLLLNWFGFSGVGYQLYYSTNLSDWLPFGNPIPGSNVVVEIPLPIEGDPLKFFRVQASD